MLENRIFQKLLAAERKGRLGHALLLISPVNSRDSFKDILSPFIQTLLCEEEGDSACGRCSSCQAFESGTPEQGFGHPDFYHLAPEKRAAYAVDQIKGMRSFLSLTRASSPIKVVLIEESEALGAGGGAAANALLKVLEEPRDKVKLILLSSRPDGVLPTIRSRCQSFRFKLEKGANQATDDNSHQDWNPLFEWIRRGSSPEQWPQLQLPADQDAFFKEKDEAQETLSQVFQKSWEEYRSTAPTLLPKQSADTLDWFQDFEMLLGALKHHGQAGLQWSSFKYRAKK